MASDNPAPFHLLNQQVAIMAQDGTVLRGTVTLVELEPIEVAPEDPYRKFVPGPARLTIERLVQVMDPYE